MKNRLWSGLLLLLTLGVPVVISGDSVFAVQKYRALYGRDTKATGLSVLSTLDTASLTQCGKACHSTPGCDGFNRFQTPSHGCDLLTGIPGAPAVLSQPGGTYYQRDAVYYCPAGFTKVDQFQRCYRLFPVAETRTDALTTCTSHEPSAGLVNIRSQAEMDYVMSLVPTATVPTTVSVTNIALSSGGASCTSNSWWDSNYDCWKAIDGDESGATSEWVILGPPAVGTWLRVMLDQTYKVDSISILTRCFKNYQNKGFRIDFSDGSSGSGTLDRFYGNDRDDCAATYWKDYTITSAVTSYVHFEVTSTYIDQYNGMREMKIHGTPVDSYWTGGKSVGTTWYWNADPMTYVNWANGVAPRNQTDTCLLVATSPNGFTTVDCANSYQKMPFVCESPILVK